MPEASQNSGGIDFQNVYDLVCILFDNPDTKNRGIFVRKVFQDISKPEKIYDHNGLQYHGSKQTYKVNNQHILQ